jgi:hypothetical protein
MIGKTAIAAGLLALGALVLPHVSSAAPLAPANGKAVAESGLVKRVQYDRPSCRRVCVETDYYGSCRRWRTVCDY